MSQINQNNTKSTKTARMVFCGGLGNQLFQYAVYLYLKKIGVSAIPDLDAYKYEAYHNGFEVQKIMSVDFENLITEVEKYREQHDIKKNEFRRILKLIRLKLLGYKTIYDTQASSPSELDKILRQHNKIQLAGFFQSPKFIDIVENTLRNQFYDNICLGEKCEETLLSVKGRNTVSLHIRRGDYLDIPIYNVFDGLGYYERAVEYFRSKIESPLFMIFSNDPQWVKENLNLGKDSVSITYNNGKDSYKDLLMMTRCQHNIIANSSFSWWGAWLNPNKNKIVVCPTMWFRDKMSSAIVPDSWIKMGN